MILGLNDGNVTQLGIEWLIGTFSYMLVILKVLKNVLKVVKYKGFEVWEIIALQATNV